jgi:SAM-dependent methyltransferase
MSDPSTAPAIRFTALNGIAYEHSMGRWSRKLAPLLIRFGGLSDGDRVLDVGCGTGSLIFALPQLANISEAIGIDEAAPYLHYARSQNHDARIKFEQADAVSLPFGGATFDRAFCLLVLQFIPDTPRAVAEMLRVVRPGGVVAAAVWDSFSGMPQSRILWDTAAVLDPAAAAPRAIFRPLNEPGEMANLWRQLGLLNVQQTSLLIRMEFPSFGDYWRSFTTGEGPQGQYVVGLSEAARATLTEHMRRAYLCNRPDGPRSFVAVAWACRGTVPIGPLS